MSVCPITPLSFNSLLGWEEIVMVRKGQLYIALHNLISISYYICILTPSTNLGNPRVTPEVTRDVCLLARMMAANLYCSQIEDLMFEVQITSVLHLSFFYEYKGEMTVISLK
jgi:hypothetical protein